VRNYVIHAVIVTDVERLRLSIVTVSIMIEIDDDDDVHDDNNNDAYDDILLAILIMMCIHIISMLSVTT